MASPYNTILNFIGSESPTETVESYITQGRRGGFPSTKTNLGDYISPIEGPNQDDTYDDILSDIVSKTLQNSPVLRYFYTMLYNKNFQPDINGYSLIYLIPPHLSGIEDIVTDDVITDISRMSIFLAVDFTPPDTSIEFDSVNGSILSIPFATEHRVNNQCTVSYVDSSNLSIYGFHLKWMEYIRAVTLGMVEPSEEYLDDDSAILDYVGSIYCIKFKPSAINDFRNSITFVSKTYGVFPISLPEKEIVGSRNTNELSIINITYACADHRRYTWGSQNMFIMKEFLDDIESTFGGI
ncbi:MAG: hypothetical protein QXD03_03700 [Candidatus Anstonellales archaeon]